MKTGVELITEKRIKHDPAGYDLQHDKEHKHGELAMVASVLALHHTDARVIEPAERWDSNSDPWGLKNKYKDDIIGRLSEAGALIAAEIDRLQDEEISQLEEVPYQESGLICEKCGYTDSIKCTIYGLNDGEDDAVTILCGKHAAEEGYCCCCGEFCAGMTSFDFHHPGYCDNCYDEVKSSDEDDLDDEY